MRINYYPPRGDNKEGWDNIDIFGWLGYPMQIKVDFLCRDSILAAPLVLDLALFFDLAQRAGHEGHPGVALVLLQEPAGTRPGLYPEHDLFIQQTKLKNTLRYLMGEEQITHLGIEYYQRRTDEILPSHPQRAGRRAGARHGLLRRPADAGRGSAAPAPLQRDHRPDRGHRRRPTAATTRW